MPSQDSHTGEQNQGDPAMIEEKLAETRPLRQFG
jgi:hypothetical protein